MERGPLSTGEKQKDKKGAGLLFCFRIKKKKMQMTSLGSGYFLELG